MPIRWVFVRDRDGTHRDEYFYTTDPALDVRRIIATITPAAGTSRPPSRNCAPASPGDDAGVVPNDGAAGHPVPVRAVLGRGVALQRPAAARRIVAIAGRARRR